MANIFDVKKKLNSLVNKSKPTDEGFSYICQLDGYQCVGRKKIIQYLQEKHTDKYNDLKAGFEDDKDFQSQLSKLVMTVPYSEKDTNISQPKTVEKEAEAEDSNEAEIEKSKKNYPLTLDYMKAIDVRTTKIPNYGSLAGRIARLLALILRSEKSEDGCVTVFSRQTDEEVGGCQDIHGFIEANHPQFLENLFAMFPPAKKRIEQFMLKAANDFDLIVPTWQMVEKLQKEESDRAAWERKKEMEERLQKAKEARAEMERRRKEEQEKRLALKRKQAEEERNNEYKSMKISPSTENAEEILKIKKELQRLDTVLTGNTKGKNKTKLKEKQTEQREKLKKILACNKEKSINKRLSDCLENLSPKQLRKLSMEYLNNIQTLDEVNWVEICQTVKIGDDFEYLTDFLGCLYEMAKFHGKKGFKVGHVLITSKQSEAIVEKGIRSLRDNISEGFIIPTSWDMDKPYPGLGPKWNRKMDSKLLVGASRFGKNLLKIVKNDTQLSSLSLDSNGAVKEVVRTRFGHLINVYITRGQPAEEFGTSLYSLDKEDEEELDHLGPDDQEVQKVEEVSVVEKDVENKENQGNNTVQETTEKEQHVEENVKELVTLDDDEEVEDLREEIDDSLLDESD